MKRPWLSTALPVVTFAGGVCLYQAAVYVIDVLAAIGISREYFAWFGRPRLELALAILNTATIAVPMVIFFAVGTLLIYYLLRRPPPWSFMLAFVGGVAACFAFWTASFILFVPDLPSGVEPYPPSVLLGQLLLPPWWSVPSALAPWLGLAIAGWFISRSARVEA